jgi:hypothetical protein
MILREGHDLDQLDLRLVDAGGVGKCDRAAGRRVVALGRAPPERKALAAGMRSEKCSPPRDGSS